MPSQHAARFDVRLRTRRTAVALAGAVALVMGTVGTSVATGAPSNGDANDADADADAAATGEYEACYPNFGLGKVVEIVVEVDGVVPTPPLTFDEDVQVVTTFESDGGPTTCIPEVVTDELWDAESFWADLFGIDAPVGNYVFLPLDLDGDDGPFEFCTASQTLTLVGAPPGYTVKVGTAVVAPTPFIFCPGAEEAVLAEAETLPGMTPAAFAALEEFVDGTGPCTGPNDSSPELTDAADALVNALSGQFLDGYQEAVEGGVSACGEVDEAVDWFAYQTLYDLEVGRQAVFQLTTPPAPAPEAVVVTPTFTG